MSNKGSLVEPTPKKLSKIGGIFHFQEVVDKVHKNEENLPQKPIFNVFFKVEVLQEKLTEAINIVKQEKKWVVL